MRYLLIIILIVITSACFVENAWSAIIKIERDKEFQIQKMKLKILQNGQELMKYSNN